MNPAGSGTEGTMKTSQRSWKWGRAANTFQTVDGADCSPAFTLVEMLVVVAIIAILSALTLPALKGLVGATGTRAGVNLVMTTMDQARAAAIENGTDVHVGFPPNPSGDEAFSSLIVFRGSRPDEAGPAYKPLSRWIRLPTGVFVDSTEITDTLPASPADFLPLLASEKINPRVVTYDRFGRIRNLAGTNTLKVGEGIVAGSGLQFKGSGPGAFDTLTAQPLTGRWILKPL
jgi:prepilin-type N-terminal cleavage/methylation domain-containing protein